MIDVGTQTNAHDQLFLQEYVNDEAVTFNDDSDVFHEKPPAHLSATYATIFFYQNF